MGNQEEYAPACHGADGKFLQKEVSIRRGSRSQTTRAEVSQASVTHHVQATVGNVSAICGPRRRNHHTALRHSPSLSCGQRGRCGSRGEVGDEMFMVIKGE